MQAQRLSAEDVGGIVLGSDVALLLAEPSEGGVATALPIGTGVAAAYLGIHLIYVRSDIPAMYLLDAAMEIGWLRARSRWARRTLCRRSSDQSAGRE